MQTAVGLATLEMAQRVRRLWQGEPIKAPAGSSQRTPHSFTWRDIYDIVVRWRELAEPQTPIMWVDNLSKEGFDRGFGSQTFMQTGDVANMRYFPYLKRGLELLQMLVPIELNHVLNATEIAQVQAAPTISALWDVVHRDVSITLPCISVTRNGRVLEAARLVMQRAEHGFNFLIQTHIEPKRWADYNEELDNMWRLLSLEASTPNPNPDAVTERILALAFYWYNFLPLSRGTAVAGHSSIIGLLLAAKMDAAVQPPVNETVDWEALLGMATHKFSEAMHWLKDARRTPAVDVAQLPDVTKTFPTRRHRFAALNYLPEKRWTECVPKGGSKTTDIGSSSANADRSRKRKIVRYSTADIPFCDNGYSYGAAKSQPQCRKPGRTYRDWVGVEVE
eukprot:TRINITY_DN1707_c0_g1_i2.p1 TRINITY_DN1707_c0_g1~~TRINITY_DN1707_c0_g1_i2.p1  ORF type:complete len:392 (+),score=81.95 TRINITY_DN1707_c0_g1_i2:1475-2650(+)